MEIVQERITPAKAKELFAKNKHNRSLRPRHVMKLARAIENGEWQAENPMPIVLNGHELLDGQHRLAAVIEANKAVRMWIWRGAPKSVMSSIDTGISRNMADTLKLRGETNVNLLSGSLTQLYLYDTERVIGGKPDRMTPSHTDLLRLLDQHGDIRSFIASFNTATNPLKKAGSSSTLVVAEYLTHQIDSEGAAEFWHALRSGEDLTLGNPIFALRKLLFEGSSRHRLKGRVLGAVVFKAWNAWLAGETIYLLKWRANGKGSENFPEIGEIIWD